MTRIALCPRCSDPLVMTFAWPGFEFVCLGCGRLTTFLGQLPAVETPELLAACDARKAEWQELSAGLIPSTVYLQHCAQSGGGCYGEHHRRHASPEELAAHDAAAARIGERLGRPAP